MSFLSFLCENSRAKPDSDSAPCDARAHIGIRVEGKPSIIVDILPILTSGIDPAVQNWVVTSGTEAPPAAVIGTTLPLAGFEDNP